MSNKTELLPCPFCGGNKAYPNIELGKHWVECRECTAESGDYRTEAEAIAAWNTRAPVEYDGWFYLPKPKESIVQYGAQRTEKTEHGYKVTQPVEVIESAIRSWGDELGEYIMKRICEVWSTRTALGNGTCEVECFDDGVDEGLDGEWFSYAPPTWYLSCGHTSQGTEKPNFCPSCGKAVKR